MKLLLLTVLCLVVATQARSLKKRRDVQSTMAELGKKFPMQEWQQFWSKLVETLGSQRVEFEKKLEENKGNMDMTLDQFKDKLTDKYPQLKTYWGQVQTKWNVMAEKMKTITLKDVADFLKTKMQTYVQTLNYDSVRDWWKDAKVYLLTYWNQMSGSQ